jgi:hypothetical protein
MNDNELKRQEEHRQRWINYMQKAGPDSILHGTILPEPWALETQKPRKNFTKETTMEEVCYICMVFVLVSLAVGIFVGSVGTLVFTHERSSQRMEGTR